MPLVRMCEKMCTHTHTLACMCLPACRPVRGNAFFLLVFRCIALGLIPLSSHPPGHRNIHVSAEPHSCASVFKLILLNFFPHFVGSSTSFWSFRLKFFFFLLFFRWFFLLFFFVNGSVLKLMAATAIKVILVS